MKAELKYSEQEENDKGKKQKQPRLEMEKKTVKFKIINKKEA